MTKLNPDFGCAIIDGVWSEIGSALEPKEGWIRRQGREPVFGRRAFVLRPFAANAVLAAAGYNFRRLPAWLAAIWRALIAAILARTDPPAIAQPA